MDNKHLSWNDRLIIERMLLDKKFTIRDISKAIGVSVMTIYNEKKRARYMHKNSDWTFTDRYSPDIAQKRYEDNMKVKGRVSKLKEDSKLKSYIEKCIVEKGYSPKAILLEIKVKGLVFDTEIKSVNTIYNAIRKGYFENVSMEDLPRKGRIKQKKKRVKVQKRASSGTSIEKRPKEIKEREIFGHWEMDCVKGTNSTKKTLLVFTERKTRYEVIEVMKACNKDEVRKAINRIEKRIGSLFYRVFQSITVDNGSEFKDCKSMEKALYRKGKRTEIYYCHPYAPHERGSNENQNILIRRFYPKGSNFDKTIKKDKVKEVEKWINDYPRNLFDGFTSWDKLKEEFLKMGIKPLRL